MCSTIPFAIEAAGCDGVVLNLALFVCVQSDNSGRALNMSNGLNATATVTEDDEVDGPMNKQVSATF
ncbi:unnamed protein product [Mesocestoides corti]|uniref:Uncharacterized protein n=1 Tax=Mesocestoides corti TaxID=53468 RepID=A0A0R3UBP1_MESCO|nr:unnamed protein product [Mesocestoides corti]